MRHSGEGSSDPLGRDSSIRLIVKNVIEEIILKSRYLLFPIIIMLFWEIMVTTADFFRIQYGHVETSELIEHTIHTLELLDNMMIANLIWLVCAGSYYVFIDNTYPDPPLKKRPRCLTHISAGILKEKMAGSLIGVSSVYLLRIFLNTTIMSSEKVNWYNMGLLLAIHTIFIIGLLAFAHTNAAPHHVHAEEVAGYVKKEDAQVRLET